MDGGREGGREGGEGGREGGREGERAGKGGGAEPRLGVPLRKRRHILRRLEALDMSARESNRTRVCAHKHTRRHVILWCRYTQEIKSMI